jgi:hypothetical protein
VLLAASSLTLALPVGLGSQARAAADIRGPKVSDSLPVKLKPGPGTVSAPYRTIDKDGTAWSRVGSATVPSASGSEDAGMVASAVNAYYPGERIQAVCGGFSVTRA